MVRPTILAWIGVASVSGAKNIEAKTATKSWYLLSVIACQYPEFSKGQDTTRI
jgi:hypothetical protein